MKFYINIYSICLIWIFSVWSFNVFISDEILDSTSVEGLTISPGYSTRFVLSKYSLEKQPIPYSACTPDLTSPLSYKSDCYKALMSQPNRLYHFSDCRNMCFQKYLGNQCHCQSTFYNFFFYPSMRPCSIPQDSSFNNSAIDFACLTKYWYEYTQTDSILNNCDCPLECKSSGYSIASSFAQFPTLNYYQQMYANDSLIISRLTENNIENNYETVRNSVARLSIFYNELKETVITENVKTKTFDLISQIGGTLGLFLGLSFLSLFEFLELLVQSLIVVFHEKYLRQNRIDSDNNKTDGEAVVQNEIDQPWFETVLKRFLFIIVS